jgi:hypothetical protein
VAKRRELEAAIDEAIRTSAFTLVYQPIVVLGSDEMVGVEAPGVQRARRQSHGAGVSATRGETEKAVRRTAGDALAGRCTGQNVACEDGQDVDHWWLASPRPPLG